MLRASGIGGAWSPEPGNAPQGPAGGSPVQGSPVQGSPASAATDHNEGMQAHPVRLEATLGEPHSGLVHLVALLGGLPARVGLGPVTVDVAATTGAGDVTTLAWSVANRSDAPVRVRSVTLVFSVDGGAAPLGLLANGYQSWSPSAHRVLGHHTDPSTARAARILRSAHHADAEPVVGDELRSEWVALVTGGPAAGAPLLLGFDGGDRHDGTVRLRRTDGDAGGGGTRIGSAECRAEAFLGGARLDAGASRSLHRIVVDDRADADGPAKLASWATDVGRRHRARIDHPYLTGWCSWYHYFETVTERDFRAELARSDDWPFEVFQLDDGYQRALGDWLACNDAFPSSLDALAGAVRESGRVPGLWIAPFLVGPDSELFDRHPGWVVRETPGSRDGPEGGRPVRAWWNPAWTGTADGTVYTLDTSNPEVTDHLESVASELVGAGFGYLKLDFTFSPSIEGRCHDETMTPAERVRAGFDAIRRGAGEETFLLGCGVPLANVVGVVDGCRIGPDVAPLWDLAPEAEVVPGYLRTQPATRFAVAGTLARSHLHRRLWLNDPDCVMVRETATDLTTEQMTTWARTVALSGGLAFVSDDLGLVGPAGRALFDDVVAIGRDSDRLAREGRAAVCPDLVDRSEPTFLRTGALELQIDPETGRSELRG